MRKLYMSISLALVLAIGLWLGLLGTASAQRHAPRSQRAHVTATHRAVNVSSDPSGEGTDQPDGEQSTESTSSNETDSHQDPNGQDVNHECPPNCETASGEQP